MRGQLHTTTQVVAPMSGTVVALCDVPDPVFAALMIGPGLAILPDEPDAEEAVRVVVVAPVGGRMVSVYPHAVVVALDADRSVLVHLGVDTEDLATACFDVAVEEGELCWPVSRCSHGRRRVSGSRIVRSCARWWRCRPSPTTSRSWSSRATGWPRARPC